MKTFPETEKTDHGCMTQHLPNLTLLRSENREKIIRTIYPREHPLGQKEELTLKIWGKRVAAIFAHK